MKINRRIFLKGLLEWMVENRAVDIVQPDLNYNGGFIRTARVARLAGAAGMEITPHSPSHDATEAYMLHLASATPNLGKFQEYNSAPHEPQHWHAPRLEVKKGEIEVPEGPGLGITIDPEILKKAEKL